MSEKLKFTVSGNRKRKKITIARDMEVCLGLIFTLRLCEHYMYIGSASGNSLCPNGLVWDDGCGGVEYIKSMLKMSIEQVENFDKTLALVELKQALERVDEIAELVQ